MNKLIPFAKMVSKKTGLPSLYRTSVVVDEKNQPLGFVFGRDSFISFLEKIDSEFEKKIDNPQKAFDNPAGKLIDLIEEKLSINPAFAKELKSSIDRANKTGWIPFKDVLRVLNV